MDNHDKERLFAWLDLNRDWMIQRLQEVLRIPSVKDVSQPNAPFGIEIRRALDYTLNLCAEMGFTVHDDEGYAGHAEFGQGDEMVASLGHLDVVPAGDGWHFGPFEAEISDGYIYARGSSDDKGPIYAALYGAKSLMESGLPISRRIRIIFGGDEESGFECVDHYWNISQNERPRYAFTPDSSFPLTYAEKGIANVTIKLPLANSSDNTPTDSDGLQLVSFCGGNRPNMVPDLAAARLSARPEILLEAATQLQRYWDHNVSAELKMGEILIRAIGKSAHGSTPLEGDSAIVRLARALKAVLPAQNHSWLDFIIRSSLADGFGLGVARTCPVTGPLSCNLGVAALESRALKLTYNIRYPVHQDAAELLKAIAAGIELVHAAIVEHHDMAPLFIPLDQEPVKTLLKAYREETGDTQSLPETMGGGTYARATPNAVAFGATFPGGSDGPPHQPDERFSVDTLLRSARIFARALYELAR